MFNQQKKVVLSSKIVIDKSCTHVSNMFAALDDDNNLNKIEDYIIYIERKEFPLGQMNHWSIASRTNLFRWSSDLQKQRVKKRYS